MTEERELFHYGTLHKSGRYPWGSGKGPQRNPKFLNYVAELRNKGLSDTDIAKGLDISRVQLHANLQIAKHEIKQGEIKRARDLKEKGLSNVAIGEQMKKNESSVRALLAEGAQEKNDMLKNTANMLKSNVDKKGMIDVGTGVELYIGGVSKEKLGTAVAMLQEQGYELYKFQVEQLSTGKKTNMKVIAPPGTPYKAVYQNQDQIHQIMDFSDDGGRSFKKFQKPLDISSKRVGIRYGEEGGAEMDGVIQVRRGVDDVSLGNSKYAQVRVSVDGTHYLKGMALYSDDLPHGVDLMFNTNKSNTGNKLDAMKEQKEDPNNKGQIDPDMPFGSALKRQIIEVQHDGTQKVTSVMNIVNEEGDWDKWSKSIASQVLSKQSPALAKQQLALKLASKQDELDEIRQLTNPAVRKKLLLSLSDDLDSSAVHLKAAALPRQRTQVILPSNSLKEHEIYAPNFRNGEKVVLVRYPHGGIFEIPELTVNNSKSNKAIDPIRGAKDAVAIHSNVAARLSGADFDGDTVLVIPNDKRAFKNAEPLAALKGFDNRTAYPAYEGMVKIKDMKNPTAMTGRLMGDISNLITDMTIQGASSNELARAVKHSMVVIDAQKHSLNYKQSAIDNGISELKKRYQGKANGGASTLISRSTSDQKVDKRTARPAKDGGGIDAATGEKRYVLAKDATYVNKAGQTVTKTELSTKMAETNDARTLISSSGTVMEHVYADHANRLKAMANAARKEYLATPSQKIDLSSKAAYAKEVASLNDKLSIALRNAPLERQAQLFANVNLKAKLQANPNMDKAEIKKLKTLVLTEARNRTDAKKTRITVTPTEWHAIQAGAVSQNQLEKILDNMDDVDIKALATPRNLPAMNATKVARAKAMMSANFERSDIADALGISVSTLNNALSEGA